MNKYDITFMGHMTFDEVVHFDGKRSVGNGGSLYISSAVPVRLGLKTAVIVKMAEKDKNILKIMDKLGVSTYVIPSSTTTYIKLVYPTSDADNREFFIEKDAGIIKNDEVPDIESRFLHLSGLADIEYDTELLKGLKKKFKYVSIDMQSLVRHVDKITHRISFDDDVRKKEVASIVDGMKLDSLEAKILTGEENIEKAAIIFEKWGCPEVMITESSGVLLRANGKTYYEKFTNCSNIGRTGRGDTTFAAYLSSKIDHNYAEALKFAAALVSIKMEKDGPFTGSLDDVKKRMNLVALREVSASR